MKNYLKILIAFFLLTPNFSVISMQEDDLIQLNPYQQIEELNRAKYLATSGNLPNEIWVLILIFSYLNENILSSSKVKDIHTGLSDLKIKLCAHSKNLKLTCSNFHSINKELNFIKAELRRFYKPLLRNIFLEHRDGGFYPKKRFFTAKDELESQV